MLMMTTMTVIERLIPEVPEDADHVNIVDSLSDHGSTHNSLRDQNYTRHCSNRAYPNIFTVTMGAGLKHVRLLPAYTT
jgi:hypothetical protein